MKDCYGSLVKVGNEGGESAFAACLISERSYLRNSCVLGTEIIPF